MLFLKRGFLMKNKFLLVLSSLVVVVPSMVVYITKSGKEVQRVEAYPTTSLPTTIYLKDNTETEIRNYYNDANALKGDALLASLKTILKNNQKYFSYESNATIWKLYEISARDWVKSPASAISGYNSSTNTITGYSYDTNASNIYVHALYVNRNVANQQKASEHSDLAWGINQEHVWAKSNGYEDSGQGGARGDPRNLIAGNARVNQTEHSNYYYGYVDKTQTYTSPLSSDPTRYAHLSGNYRGYSRTYPTLKTEGGTQYYVFEPQDSDKGDIARAIFYMAARYNYVSGSDPDGINSNNPNLALTNNLLLYRTSGYQSTTTNPGYMGIMRDLLEWNRLDPPDEYEKHRNNLLYNNYTMNRNPFIDFPEWADIIWDNGEDKSTNVSSDPVSEPQTLSISKGYFNLQTGKSNLVTATTKDGAPIEWTVEDTSIATIEKNSSSSFEGIKLTGINTGETTLTATATVEGTLRTKTVKVKVIMGSPLVNVRVASDKRTAYNVGDTFEAPEVTAEYEDGSKEVVSDAVFTGADLTTAGDKKVTVSVTRGGITKTAQFTIKVSDPAPVDPEPTDKGGLSLTTIIIIAVAAGVVVIAVVLILALNPKARKKAGKTIKKKTKKAAKKTAKKMLK